MDNDIFSQNNRMLHNKMQWRLSNSTADTYQSISQYERSAERNDHRDTYLSWISTKFLSEKSKIFGTKLSHLQL